MTKTELTDSLILLPPDVWNWEGCDEGAQLLGDVGVASFFIMSFIFLN